MAIVRVDPDQHDRFNIVQVDSDATDNMAAIHEIGDWAEENGFVRADEYRLRKARRADGKQLFRGVCYRLDGDERRSIEEHKQRLHALVQPRE